MFHAADAWNPHAQTTFTAGGQLGRGLAHNALACAQRFRDACHRGDWNESEDAAWTLADVTMAASDIASSQVCSSGAGVLDAEVLCLAASSARSGLLLVVAALRARVRSSPAQAESSSAPGLTRTATAACSALMPDAWPLDIADDLLSTAGLIDSLLWVAAVPAADRGYDELCARRASAELMVSLLEGATQTKRKAIEIAFLHDTQYAEPMESLVCALIQGVPDPQLHQIMFEILWRAVRRVAHGPAFSTLARAHPALMHVERRDFGLCARIQALTADDVANNSQDLAFELNIWGAPPQFTGSLSATGETVRLIFGSCAFVLAREDGQGEPVEIPWEALALEGVAYPDRDTSIVRLVMKPDAPTRIANEWREANMPNALEFSIGASGDQIEKALANVRCGFPALDRCVAAPVPGQTAGAQAPCAPTAAWSIAAHCKVEPNPVPSRQAEAMPANAPPSVFGAGANAPLPMRTSMETPCAQPFQPQQATIQRSSGSFLFRQYSKADPAAPNQTTTGVCDTLAAAPLGYQPRPTPTFQLQHNAQPPTTTPPFDVQPPIATSRAAAEKGASPAHSIVSISDMESTPGRNGRASSVDAHRMDAETPPEAKSSVAVLPNTSNKSDYKACPQKVPFGSGPPKATAAKTMPPKPPAFLRVATTPENKSAYRPSTLNSDVALLALKKNAAVERPPHDLNARVPSSGNIKHGAPRSSRALRAPSAMQRLKRLFGIAGPIHGNIKPVETPVVILDETQLGTSGTCRSLQDKEKTSEPLQKQPAEAVAPIRRGYAALSYETLKAVCRGRGLSGIGTHADLLRRIEEKSAQPLAASRAASLVSGNQAATLKVPPATDGAQRPKKINEVAVKPGAFRGTQKPNVRANPFAFPPGAGNRKRPRTQEESGVSATHPLFRVLRDADRLAKEVEDVQREFRKHQTAVEVAGQEAQALLDDISAVPAV